MPILSKTKKSNRPPLMVLFMGAGGTGKTTAAMTFPDPFICDGESGTRNYENTIEGATFQTKQFGAVLKAVREFKTSGKITWKEGAGLLEYSPKTFVIDPLTAFWDSIQAAKFQDSMNSQGISVVTGTEKPKGEKDTYAAWGAIKTHWRTLMSELQSSGINFVATAHEKDEMKTVKNDRGFMEVINTGKIIANSEKGYEYVFDLILRLMTEGERRYAIVLKSRLKNADRTDRFKVGQKLDKWDFAFLTSGMTDNVSVSDTQTEAAAAAADRDIVEKDPESLKLASQIRSNLLPLYGIPNKDFELYCVNKVLQDGVTKLATPGEDGKVHLSAIKPDMLRWLCDVLQSDASRLKLLQRIEDLKKEAGAK